jgi:class 3 adenylate cyclase/tetratricopeptide (TPR) repeat protein
MKCPSCGTENREGRKFCAECGAPLALVCSACGTANEPGERFCGDCGAALAAPPRQEAAPTTQPAAERRLVSVVFADLVGFTAASEQRDAEETRELLSRYFDTSKRLISLYGGTVEKFIGDAVMAVWGTPTATEDDAERAVRAALELVAAVSALGDEVGAPELRARAGVLTGEAAVTIGAEGEGMVAGDLVNTASRVQSVAEPGSVYVGDSTRRATEQTVVYEDAGMHELKGKEGLTPLWKAMRIVSGVRGSLKSQGLEAPFVGRDRELRQIKTLFHACAEERKAHLVSVTGIAGIGKSRLGWEFYKYIDGFVDTTYWHRGRCLSYGEGVTYWALADMVRMRCRIAEDEEPASALKKLDATLEEHLLDAEDRRFVQPRLAQLLGLAEHEAGDKQDLFAAWRLFFERLAETYPTVLAFEDMQWADASLLDFVEYLLEWSRHHPLFVITLARPELTERRPNWGAGHRNFSSVYLEPLSQPAMVDLLTGLVPGLPAPLQEQILARAEGVPLYAVETVRMLLDRGLLTQEGSAYRLTGAVEALEVPETLQALIAARLDGLSTEERRLLQDGAVLGKTFARAGLVALSGLSEEELEPLLNSLVRKEVLSVQADPRSPEHGQYGYLQDLVRHVAYETLSKRERRARHLAAAAHLGSVFAEEDEVAEVVASHYLAAYEAAPDADDAGEIKDKARGALLRAAERAAALAAATEAHRYFAQAATLADDPLAEAELRERAGQMAMAAGQRADAREAYERAMALLEESEQTHAAARVSARLGEVDFVDGHPELARERMERSFAVLSGDEPDADLGLLAAELGRMHFFEGDPELAAERIEYALDIAEALRLPEVTSQALNTKSLILAPRRPEESFGLLRHALAIALEHDLTAPSLRSYYNLSFFSLNRERWDEGLRYLESGLALARARGDRGSEWRHLANMTDCLQYLGDWDGALARAADLLDIASPQVSLNIINPLTRIHTSRGAVDEARALVDAHPGGEELADRQLRGGYVLAQSVVLRAEGRFPEALAAAEQAFGVQRDINALGSVEALVESVESALALDDLEKADQILSGLDDLSPSAVTQMLQGQRARLTARLGARRGEREETERNFKRAGAGFRELGVPFWLGVTLVEHGEWLTSQSRSEEAEPLRTEAREIFERLEATLWLERLDQAEAGTALTAS